MIRYKIDVMAALNAVGYNPQKLRDDRLMAESTMTKIRHGILVAPATLNVICNLLHCQPGDILEHIPD